MTTNPQQLGGRPERTLFFSDRYEWLGPAIVLLSAQYFVMQVVVAWTYRPSYNFLANAISDLGRTSCSATVCSPRWPLMDLSMSLVGLSMIFSSRLIYREFRFSGAPRERVAAICAFGLLVPAGVGAILLAVFAENHNYGHLHTIGTAAVVAFGQLAILVLGIAVRQLPGWLRGFMVATSLLVLLTGISYAFDHLWGFGAGEMERIVQFPESIWLILFGMYISQRHWAERSAPAKRR